MCTILVASRIREDFPLIAAANRDEFLARPASPPRELRPGLWAGTDLEKGGTWLGATREGLFVGLTNQHTERLLPPAPRSRGELVLGALAAGSVQGALDLLRQAELSLYNPFNLFVGDARQLFVLHSWKSPEPLPLPPGVHVLANDELHSPLYPKTLRAEALAAPWLQAPWPELLPGLTAALGDHHLPPLPPRPPVCDEELRPAAALLQALCVHTPFGYGTRSSAVVAVAPGGLAHYWFADGAPCVTPFARVFLNLRLSTPRREGRLQAFSPEVWGTSGVGRAGGGSGCFCQGYLMREW